MAWVRSTCSIYQYYRSSINEYYHTDTITAQVRLNWILYYIALCNLFSMCDTSYFVCTFSYILNRLLPMKSGITLAYGTTSLEIGEQNMRTDKLVQILEDIWTIQSTQLDGQLVALEISLDTTKLLHSTVQTMDLDHLTLFVFKNRLLQNQIHVSPDALQDGRQMFQVAYLKMMHVKVLAKKELALKRLITVCKWIQAYLNFLYYSRLQS